jgi:hypothetical protein
MMPDYGIELDVVNLLDAAVAANCNSALLNFLDRSGQLLPIPK